MFGSLFNAFISGDSKSESNSETFALTPYQGPREVHDLDHAERVLDRVASMQEALDNGVYNKDTANDIVSGIEGVIIYLLNAGIPKVKVSEQVMDPAAYWLGMSFLNDDGGDVNLWKVRERIDHLLADVKNRHLL